MAPTLKVSGDGATPSLTRTPSRADALRPARPVPVSKSQPADTLDGGWDRRLRRGSIAPDRTIDLHGHTLASAHHALETALSRAVADDVRVLLVVTGKPPRASEARRGLIRASIGEWLSVSSHRARIAAVRVAHPRHGGSGALYLILRRRREEAPPR
ncbi:Smr/MutS family protein [uncultured Sphingomonas sp.]|uniref:Smr/MutS family protein n=1 Tax=uncultured Sphingomonas sp. TaxID=158754 RepID=UPI0025F265CF|nr:Smr/MutS family protein [uncultured Sphingomonas sp.]